ncbi:MAG: ATP-dependent metallopeptidase FtsH/Yme1/Tma family protein [Clostridia bacterium]|nr:ATP-dependent metallopeptidase FtsH/Yme1/Tma family protein [Clostridia bacterium]NCC42389.1 ATP-dependent metallopeptidase FtsH/Yme1/Tma family protein [Clostridia bacterium]
MDQRPNNYNDQRPNGPGQNGNGGPTGPKNKSSLLVLLICVLATLLIWTLFSNIMQESTSKEITYDKFIEMLDEGQIKSVELQDGVLTIVPTEQKVDGIEFQYSTTAMEDSTTLTARLEAAKAKNKQDITFNEIQPDPTGSVIYTIVSLLIPFVLLIVGMNWIMRKMNKGGGMMGGVGKSKAKAYVQKETGVTFKDVAGEDEAKESLQEVVDFLHNPLKYTTIGAKLPKGALLVGPPGTGKTLLAKAVAGEAHVPFFSLSGSDFVEMFVGVGASRVRDLFEEAKKNAPCIIFIDEIDAIGKSRDSKYGGGNDEREQTLNQLLAEMDGFDTSAGILILAATNRPEILDPALLRPGRFDRRVIVERPDLKGRVNILKVHSKDVSLDETVDLDAIALATSGAVGSDLANMINEAAILAVKNGRKAVAQQDLYEAVEVVLVGKEKKDRILSQEERKIVSYHEVGHALVSALQKDAEPVQKITIVPRTMGALGYVMQVPEEEKYLNTKTELETMLVGFLAGRAAEELVFGNVTTGASNDIEKATQIARAMITQYGMSEKFGLMGLASVDNQYLGGRASLNCGDATATEIDHEVMIMLKSSYEQAKTILAGHREALDRIAAFLIEKETITGKEFMEILREVEGNNKLGTSAQEDQFSMQGISEDDDYDMERKVGPTNLFDNDDDDAAEAGRLDGSESDDMTSDGTTSNSKVDNTSSDNKDL